MEELATVPALADYRSGFTPCAVHERTRRTYALAKGDYEQAVVILDAKLQVIATIAATADIGLPTHDPGCFAGADYEPYLRDLAVHGDQVVILTSDDRPRCSNGYCSPSTAGTSAQRSTLLLLDLDGDFQRRMAFGRFENPWAVTASRGRAFVVDQGPTRHTKVLHVIDIQSGDCMQRAVFELNCRPQAISAVCVDADRIYIAVRNDRVVVLRLAGSEA